MCFDWPLQSAKHILFEFAHWTPTETGTECTLTRPQSSEKFAEQLN